MKNHHDHKNNDASANVVNVSATDKKAIMLVITCTILTSIGQILFKYSTARMDSFYAIITNIPLILGLIIYLMASVLLIVALRSGHLSVLYPFVALSFVWVTLLSIFLFNEHVATHNWLGIIAIIIGVSLIGMGSSK